jgi:hypothetical protein
MKTGKKTSITQQVFINLKQRKFSQNIIESHRYFFEYDFHPKKIDINDKKIGNHRSICCHSKCHYSYIHFFRWIYQIQ